MTSNRFGLGVLIRIILILANLFLLAFAWVWADLFFTYILLSLVLTAQVIELLRFVNKTNRELHKFLEAIRHEDYSVSFSGNKLGKSFQQLDQSFRELVEKLKKARVNQQSHTDLLQMVVENLSLGILVVEKNGTVYLMNQAARDMLNSPHFRNWEMFRKKKPGFAGQLGNFDFEGRRLIHLNGSEFYLDLEHIDLVGERYHLISFSDLKNEIEQKEIEAWHKLIRILAHEVMNSVTPISSLSETVHQMLSDEKGEAITTEDFTSDRIDDIREAMGTIVRRSKGMLNFVEEYRKLTKLPAPQYEVFPVAELFVEVSALMSAQARKAGIELITEVTPPKLALRADRKMVEQVLINLVSNSIYALDSHDNGKIELKASITEDHTLIQVQDNGKGIPENILMSVFIPFFSTRKNGSGIGLTLSKNIMKLHQGNITVQSQEGEGALFLLSFVT
ncbi:MAG: sensor histidine kinase [Owenweeksia sp.]